MPFKPNVIHEDPAEVPGEFRLSDDLAALADQLQADAAHLEACYPAEPFDKSLADRQRAAGGKRRVGRWLTAVAGGLTALSLALFGAAAAWHFASGDSAVGVAGRATSDGDRIASSGNRGAVALDSPRGETDDSTRVRLAGHKDAADEADAMPAELPAMDIPRQLEGRQLLFLQDFSTPEVDGFSDLHPDVDISI